MYVRGYNKLSDMESTPTKHKKKTSLQNKAFWTVLFGSIALVLLMTIIELIVLSYTVLLNYKTDTIQDLSFAISLIDQDYLDNLFAKTKEIYFSTPEEIRRQQFTDEYREYYMDLIDDDFRYYRKILENCRVEEELINVALVFPDEKNGRLVYVLDGDKVENAYFPGQYLEQAYNEIGSFEQMREVSASSSKLSVTYGRIYGITGTNFMDLYSKSGEWIGYGIVDVGLGDFMGKVLFFLLAFLPALIVIIILTATLLSIKIRKHLIKPLDSLAGTARTYTARDKVQQETDTQYFKQLNIDTGDEIEDLWSTMVDMELDISKTMARIREVTEEKMELKSREDRINNELAIATNIQVGILPRTFPAFPDRNEFDIYASMKPALQVGGDFYDYFMVDQDHLAIVIADVSGKGISAALFMVIAKTLIQIETMRRGKHPAEVLTAVNKRLLEGNEAEMFVTVWLGILTISTGEVVYSNAGHEYPAICRKGQKFELFMDHHTLPVAAIEFTKFKEDKFTLEPGDTLFIYTDGVTDANNPAHERFELDRMLTALNSCPNGTPQEINDTMRNAIAEFMQDEPQFDDTTMVVFRYFGAKGEPTMSNTKEITLDALVDNLPEAMKFIEDLLETVGASVKDQTMFTIAAEELFVNIAHYAYEPKQGRCTIRAAYSLDPRQLELTFIDSGRPFNPLERKDPDVTLSAKERQIGGLGIYFVKQKVDHIEYSYENNQNILKIFKKFN